MYHRECAAACVRAGLHMCPLCRAQWPVKEFSAYGVIGLFSGGVSSVANAFRVLRDVASPAVYLTARFVNQLISTNAQYKGMTALMWAVNHEYFVVVYKLLQAGVNPNVYNIVYIDEGEKLVYSAIEQKELRLHFSTTVP